VSRLLTLTLGSNPTAVAIDQLIIAGWTGRDREAVEKHIRELQALGIKPPTSTPIFYRASVSRVTTDAAIEAVGESSGGEAEFVLLRHASRLWVGAGSDHTDREVEKYGVTVSKQLCEKPIARVLWPYDEVAEHWDRLILRSHVLASGKSVLYQEGSVAALLHPLDLMERHGALADGTLLFGGTLPAHGGVRATSEFAFELEDPVRRRKIAHAYRVQPLAILG
jgi:hypothetical protein